LICKGIGLALCLSRSKVNLEVKVGKEFRPSGLVIISQAIGGEVGKVLVITDDLNGMWGGFQKASPFFQGLDNCKKFFVINFIIVLSWGMLP
jgi:uncharacterized membrane protein YqgA involved in biofilm formation